MSRSNAFLLEHLLALRVGQFIIATTPAETIQLLDATAYLRSKKVKERKYFKRTTIGDVVRFERVRK